MTMQTDRESLETCIKNAPGESSEERTVCVWKRKVCVGTHGAIIKEQKITHLYVACCDWDQNVNWQKNPWSWSSLLKLWWLDCYRSKVELELHIIEALIRSSEVTVISSQKGLWLFDSILIPVTNTFT